MEELTQWRIIKEYPNFRVSSTGVVKNFKTENEISQRLRNGYNSVTLTDGPQSNHYLMHRLIAIYFIENPDPIKFKIVDHIDGNKLNNDITNLRWTDNSGNGKNAASKRTIFNKVIQYNLEGEELKIWDSALSIVTELKIGILGIRRCCNNVYSKYKGFIWKYEDQGRKQIVENDIDLNDYVCIGIINGNDHSNYYIFKDGSKIININNDKEITFITTPDNYKKVKLYINPYNGKIANLLVHKIINQVLKGGDYNDIIDHINRKRDDNSIDNLEVVTIKENTIRALGKSVKRIDIKTGETKVFRTIREAYISLGKNPDGNIGQVCNRKRKSLYGYKWEWCD